MIGEPRKITRGPWQVIREEHPHHLGGKHVEFRIFTVWSHPQLKGPFPVVNSSVGVGSEAGGPARHMVWIDEADAYLIAAAPQQHDALLAVQYAPGFDSLDDATKNAVRAAIAKATTIPVLSQEVQP